MEIPNNTLPLLQKPDSKNDDEKVTHPQSSFPVDGININSVTSSSSPSSSDLGTDNTIYVWTDYKIVILQRVPFGMCYLQFFGKLQGKSMSRGFPFTDPTKHRCATFALCMALETVLCDTEIQYYLKNGHDCRITTSDKGLLGETKNKRRSQPQNKLQERLNLLKSKLPTNVSIIYSDDEQKPVSSDKERSEQLERDKAEIPTSSIKRPTRIYDKQSLFQSHVIEIRDPKGELNPKELPKASSSSTQAEFDACAAVRQSQEQEKILCDMVEGKPRPGRKLRGVGQKFKKS